MYGITEWACARSAGDMWFYFSASWFWQSRPKKRWFFQSASFEEFVSKQTDSLCWSSRLWSLLRLRQELTKLIETHTGKLSEVPARARARSAIYEELLQGLTVCLIRMPHKITCLNWFCPIARLPCCPESFKSTKWTSLLEGERRDCAQPPSVE